MLPVLDSGGYAYHLYLVVVSLHIAHIIAAVIQNKAHVQ